MIQFNNISFAYENKTPIFKNLNWEICESKQNNFIHFIMSPSGYGKTSLFKIILNLIKPQQGNIQIKNDTRIAYVPQEDVLFEHLSIFENATFFQNLKSRKSEFNNELFNEYAKVLGLDSQILKSNKSINQLSGGQKRKISLLRALSLNPNIILLDEPTTGLDAQVKMEFLLQLKMIAYRYNILVLYITHHFEEPSLIGDKIHYLLKNTDGVINKITSQSVEDFKNIPPCLEAAYLVDFPVNRIEKGYYQEKTFIPNLDGTFYKREFNGHIQIFSPSGTLLN